ncbi:hypothetical protein [Hespellia stercorisuis]|uniref:hypothetical protein n=1 Tax=Hespellia stercorisuis TaxID=180311 RepID=UPI0011608978|nr:hypothetical protein [Hespellia stercorisuis]
MVRLENSCPRISARILATKISKKGGIINHAVKYVRKRSSTARANVERLIGTGYRERAGKELT